MIARILVIGHLVAAAALVGGTTGWAACNIIPSATGTFRAALGSPLRPFAAPGEALELRVRPAICDAASPGLTCASQTCAPSDVVDKVVTVVFTPPGSAARNVVVLAANCAALEPARLACAGRPDVAMATCLQVDPSGDPGALALVRQDDGVHLSFRFADTDALLAPDGDQRKLTGPATIAVTTVSDPLPCSLASDPCRSTPGTIACVDEFYAVDGTCRNDPALIDRTFGHFTALPPPNDYRAVWTPATGVCAGTQDSIRFTLDAVAG